MKIEVTKEIQLFIVSAMYDMNDNESCDDVEVFTDLHSAFEYEKELAVKFANEHNINTNPHRWGDDGEETQFPTFKESEIYIGDTKLVEDECANRLYLTIRSKTI